MNYYTQEHLLELQSQYDFLSKSIGFFKENFNFYLRNSGSSADVQTTLMDMEKEKLKLSVQIDFLTDML